MTWPLAVLCIVATIACLTAAAFGLWVSENPEDPEP